MWSLNDMLTSTKVGDLEQIMIFSVIVFRWLGSLPKLAHQYDASSNREFHRYTAKGWAVTSGSRAYPVSACRPREHRLGSAFK